MSVPCNGCRACCIGWDVKLQPADDWSQYEHTDGVLNRKPNGHCVYLGDEGCTIHDKAPEVCRRFDCRVFYLHSQEASPNTTARLVQLVGEGKLDEHLRSNNGKM